MARYRLNSGLTAKTGARDRFGEIIRRTHVDSRIPMSPSRKYIINRPPMEVIEFYLEDEQCWHVRANDAGDLISFGRAFPWLRPLAGDILQDNQGRFYRVEATMDDPKGALWDGRVLVDRAVPHGAKLRWYEKARERNLIRFVAKDGLEESPVPGEGDAGDVGGDYFHGPGSFAPTITYLHESIEPASIDRRRRYGASKEYRPRVRDEFRDIHRPQVWIRVWGQTFEHKICLQCLHPRSTVASELGSWVRRFLRTNAPYLRRNGLFSVTQMSYMEKPRVSVAGDDVAVREVILYLRTEELTFQEMPVLRNMDLSIATAPDQETMETRAGIEQEDGMDPYVIPTTGPYPWGSIEFHDYGHEPENP